ncbi:MAG: hypothetical protein WBL67_09115 [Nitrososphaeraceae archaeon]
MLPTKDKDKHLPTQLALSHSSPAFKKAILKNTASILTIQSFVKQLEISDADDLVEPEYPYCKQN